MTGHRLVYNDSAHSYHLNGRKTKSVTAVAKLVSDSFALEQWRKRQVAIGMTIDPRLVERVAVDPDNRELVDEVCEAALQVAGAHHAAHRGVQRHRASELSDLGGKLLTEQQKADAAAWQRTLDRYRIEVDPRWIEGFAIWPEYGVTGRFDRIARYQGRHIILDLKSGENAVRYPQSTAAQLALYGRAPFVSASVDTIGDKSTVTQWIPPPADLDLQTGYVVLLGDGQDVGELYEIDIEYGWEGATYALELVRWRKGFRYGAELASKVEPTNQVAKAAKAATARLAHASLLSALRLAKSEAELLRIWETSTAAGTWSEAATLAAKERKAQLAAR